MTTSQQCQQIIIIIIIISNYFYCAYYKNIACAIRYNYLPLKQKQYLQST